MLGIPKKFFLFFFLLVFGISFFVPLITSAQQPARPAEPIETDVTEAVNLSGGKPTVDGGEVPSFDLAGGMANLIEPIAQLFLAFTSWLVAMTGKLLDIAIDYSITIGENKSQWS